LTTIYVSNLPFSTSEAELEALFAQYGEVSKCNIIVDRETGKSRGFAFVEMPDDSAAAIAIRQINQTEIRSGRGSRTLNVRKSEPREPRGKSNRPRR